MNPPLVIVPARGGSKRIPRKNIRPFLGEPILARVVREVLRCELVGTVIVSSDDAEIRRIAVAAGAQAPFERSARTSDDTATLHQAVREVLQELGAADVPESVLCVLPTAVLLTAEVLAAAIDTFAAAVTAGTADSLVSVQRYRHPIERALRLNDDGTLRRADVASVGARTQDLQPAFHDAGQFYLAATAGLLDRSTLMGSRCLPFELGELQAQDIDTMADWELAELKFRARTGGV